jgi:hypothetical protein
LLARNSHTLWPLQLGLSGHCGSCPVGSTAGTVYIDMYEDKVGWITVTAKGRHQSLIQKSVGACCILCIVDRVRH